MQLVSLKVTSFRCIERAYVELKPGLNVLHGPNDLGKSTLTDAIRAVLLLTHGQKEHHSFIPWTEDLSPKVELQFEMKEKGFFKVSKAFGDGNRGQSLLSVSKDGRDFMVTTKGREVDEELRKLLRWGVPPPGGKSKIHGMPETFLTEVLMPDQSQVARILEVSLEQDPHESGKEHLTQVLQAMATDPLFRKVFASATSKVDEAYTANGQRKRGKGSPWAEARDRINDAQREVARLSADVVKSEDAANRITSLSEQLDTHRAKVEDADAQLRAFEAQWELQLKSAAARAILADIERSFEVVAKTQSEIGALTRQIEDAKQRVVRGKEAVAAAETSLERTEEQRARLESEAGEQARALECSRLGKLLAETETALATLANVAERAAEAQREVEALCAIEARAGMLEHALEASQRELDDAKLAVGEALHLDAKRAHDANEAALTKARGLKEKAAKLHAEAKEKGERLSALTLPTKVQLQSLRKLKHELDLAEAGVAGLAISIQPERPLEVTIATDDDPIAKDRIESARVVQARRAIRIVIAGVGELTAVAGRPEARTEAEDLGRRWKLEGRPVLDAARAPDLEALATMIDEAERLRLTMESCRRDAVTAEAVESEIVLRDSAELHRLMEESEVPLRGQDRHLDEAAIRRRLEAARATVGRLELVLTKNQTELARDADAIREQNERLAPRLNALGAAPEAVLERVRADRLSHERRREECKTKLDALEREAKTAIVDAAKAADAARTSLGAARAACTAAESQLSEIQSRLAAAEALLGERVRKAESADRPRHRAIVEELDRRLGAMPAAALTEVVIERARDELRNQRRLTESTEADLNEARGALAQVGGSVVREWEHDWEEALQLATRDQEDLDADYDAWRLLLDTLREAEKEQAGHLGRALVDPISERFAELTSGRYPKLALGPNLEAQSIVVDGGEREIASLSVGTKEQLATLIRICLAERLGTCLILDDQLTQSDPTRIGWVRDLLYDTAHRLQIVVLTCRPDDYVRAGRECAVVDLGKCITRYGAKRPDENPRKPDVVRKDLGELCAPTPRRPA